LLESRMRGHQREGNAKKSRPDTAQDEEQFPSSPKCKC